MKTYKKILKDKLEGLMGKGIKVTFEYSGEHIIATGSKDRIINDEESDENVIVTEKARVSIKKN